MSETTNDDRRHIAERVSDAEVAGRAEIVHDRAKAEGLHSPTLKAWFPDGLQTLGLTL